MASPSKKPTTQLNSWDAEMAREAEVAKAREDKQASSGGKIIGTADSILKVDGVPIPGNQLDVVVLHSVAHNAYYLKVDAAGRPIKFDAKNPTAPVCFAFEDADGNMAPHPASTAPQCEDCASCPLNQFGPNNEAKPCKNTRRLGLIPAGKAGAGTFDWSKPEQILAEEVKYLHVPPTSLRTWSKWVRDLTSVLNRPPFGVAARVVLAEKKLDFLTLEGVPSRLGEAIMTKVKACREEIRFPYQSPKPKGPVATATPAGKKGKSFTK